MHKTINADQLATTDLRTITEIWLGGLPDTSPEQGELCLWRAEQVFTHDMLSEGTHDQNSRRLYIALQAPNDKASIASIEARVRALLHEQGMHGEFFPAEDADTHQ